ncbi:cytochrome P450 4V2 [Caerostris darwini]|uniref:Cytochrome P450 4V2 n=1 Tax=Caerostris darwini TaxID=1538125 RepID=A0AAV4PTN1_9ARAC|nr:cytochrome P450 4V2 [Caerostris darwini]
MLLAGGFPLVSAAVLVVVVLALYLKWLRVLNIISVLPSLKLKWYNFLGHMTVLYFGRTLHPDTHISPHIRDFHILCGYNQLYARNGLSSIWFTFLEVTVCRADMVEVILTNSKEIKKGWHYEMLRPWLGNGLLLSYDEKWRRRRKLLTHAFHTSILKNYQPIMNRKCRDLIRDLESATHQDYVDIFPLMRRTSFDVVCECILGKETQTEASTTSFIHSVDEMASLAFERCHLPWLWNNFLFSLSSLGRRFSKAVRISHNFTNKLISEKKEARLAQTVEQKSGHRKLAFIDLLIEEHITNNSLTENDIRHEVDNFTFAGHDTTSVSMSWCLWLVGLHPWVQDRIHEELENIFGEDDREPTSIDLKDMEYLECVIKESLRLYPTVPLLTRELRNDIQIREYTVPSGTTVLVNTYLLHRDPEIFPNPEKFDPGRFSLKNSSGRHPFAYVPFSAGSRNCIGQRFALMEMKTVLSFILRKYKLRSLDPRDQVHALAEVTFRPAGKLRIQIRQRNQDFSFPYVYYHQ